MGKLRQLGLITVKDSSRSLVHSVEELNKYFAEAGEEQTVEADELLDTSDISENFDDRKFFFRHVTPEDIRRSVNRIKAKATGKDGISPVLISMVLPYVILVIEHMFNYSLTHAEMPTVWKTAVITPIPKIKEPTMLQHYRPISILPFLSKVLERIVSDQIINYLTENELLDPCQFAYKRNSSTQTCIIRMLDDVRQAIDDRRVTVSIFFDFSKAFDRVRHDILINKLRVIGFSCTVIRWITSYLKERTQEVHDNFEDVTSSSIRVGTGVPQGSVLGPLLFTLYVSDIYKALQHCKYNFYADDLQIYLHCEPHHLRNDIPKINEDIRSIVHWAEACGLTLNPAKTQAIIFGTARYINKIELDESMAIKINETAVQLSTNVKYLGVTINNTLSWNLQVINVVKNIRTKLYQLKISKHLLSKELKIKLITSLIFPHLDYCCGAFTDITGQLNKKLYRATNACIRFALNVKRDEHITPYYQELRWLKIDARRSYFVGCLLHNIIKTKEPNLIYKELNFRSTTASRTTRASNDLLTLPYCRTETYKRSFRFCASKLWNDLSPELRGAQSGAIFKRELYNYLLTTAGHTQ